MELSGGEFLVMLGCMEEMSEFEWRDWLRQYGLVGGLVMVGGLSLVLGIKSWWSGKVPQDAVEIMAAEEVEEEVVEEGVEELVVDVAGAVVEPGLYRLANGTRVGDAISAAGGFLDDADEEYVAKQINLAAKLTDGVKIYVAYRGEEVGGMAGVGVAGVAGAGVVNVNLASVAELEGLWGIGQARAESIIAGRPYASLDELAQKAGIPANVMAANEDKWVAN